MADYNSSTFNLSDNSVSNNNDISKIMATVVKTIDYFFETNPNANVYIQANTQQKNLLYNRIFKNYNSEITTKYIVKGQNNSFIENYVLGNSYESFYICLI